MLNKWYLIINYRLFLRNLVQLVCEDIMGRNLIEYFDYNAVVTLTMFFVSFMIVLLNYFSKGWFNKILFSTQRGKWYNPFTYVRMFLHILGHRDWKHFSNNYLMILLLGPLIEEKYGSLNFLSMVLITAFVTGLVNLFKKKSNLKGASCIVFMLIVLSAFVNINSNKIPLTLVLIIIFYIVDEIKDLGKKDSVAHYGHLVGALCGLVFGFWFLMDDPWKWVVNFIHRIF